METFNNSERFHKFGKRVSVVLPAYNEAKNLEGCVSRIEAALLKLGVSHELIIAEDGSTDGTDKIAHVLAQEDFAIKHLHSDARLGRGKAIQTAFAVAEADIVLYTDIDLSTNLQHLSDLIKAIENGADIATGSRLLKDSLITRSSSRELTSRTYNWIIRLLFKSPVHDHQCGFKAFKKSTVAPLLNEVKDQHWFWDTELIIKALKHGYRVVEIPVTWHQSKETKVSILSDARRMASGAVKLWWQSRKED